MNRLYAFLTVLFLSSPLWGEEATDPTAPFSLLRESSSASTLEGLGRIKVDHSLFKNSEEDFADVRLYRIRGEEKLEWPFLVRETRPRKREIEPRELSSEIVAFDKSEEDILDYTVKLPEDSPEVATLRIQTPLRNFEKTVSVFAKGAGEEWAPLIEKVLIYDREQFVDFRRTNIDLPVGKYELIRIRLEDATDEQQSDLRRVTRTLGKPSGPETTESTTIKTRNFRVDRFSFLTPKKPSLPQRGIVTYPLKILSQEQVAKVEGEEKKETEIILESDTIPLRRLLLSVAEKNFRRSVRIEVPTESDPEQWRSIGRESIHRYDLGGLKEEDLTIAIPETQAEQIRLLIENGDNRPIEVESVKGQGPLFEIVFQTEPDDQWQLAYHAPTADLKRPDYDTAVLERAENEGIAEETISLGDPETNPIYDESAGVSVPLWFAERWVLHVLIAAVVAILIWVLYGAARKIETVEE